MQVDEPLEPFPIKELHPLGNGNDPRVPAFAELSRRTRQTVWLTPEPRYSWGLGRCDLPAYEEFCDRGQVVRNLHGLEKVATSMSGAGR